jgi:hypothetical protein
LEERILVSAGVNSIGPKASSVELRDLILDERHERADDERSATANEPGNLIAERLSRACRHHEKKILTRRRGMTDVFLMRPERIEPKIPA